jgi:uncharacterized membrane protein
MTLILAYIMLAGFGSAWYWFVVMTMIYAWRMVFKITAGIARNKAYNQLTSLEVQVQMLANSIELLRSRPR